MDRVGLPLFPALKKVDDILTEHDVHNRLKIIASCKMVGAGRQLIAFCLGNEVVASDLGLMMSIGCIQAMQYGSNTYPGGITTHNPELKGSRFQFKIKTICPLCEQYGALSAGAALCNRMPFGSGTFFRVSLVPKGYTLNTFRSSSN